MVERLKIAVEKARAERERALTGQAPQVPAIQSAPPETSSKPVTRPAPRRGPSTGPENPWTRLERVELNQAHLERNRIITHDRKQAAYVAFDVLRTRILSTFRRHGWKRLGITSPGPNCGKTFVSANLALSCARQADCQTILMDMDLRAPSLGRVLGMADREPMAWFLSGETKAHDFLAGLSENLAVGVNVAKIDNPAETIQSPATTDTLETMIETFDPDLVIYDLPPILSSDDVLGFSGQLDCVLLVVGGGVTRPDEVTQCERLLTDQTQLLGVLMNQAEDATMSHYGYGS